jgi:hypothetical protein
MFEVRILVINFFELVILNESRVPIRNSGYTSDSFKSL